MAPSLCASPMKACLVVLMLFAPAASVVLQRTSNDRTISQVVKLLGDMVEQSKTDGEEDRVLFAKFKCYCDLNEVAKKKFIKKTADMIEGLENSIQGLLASTGVNSEDVQQLKRDMASNRESQDKANAIREKENKAFLDTKEDLNMAIQQMKDALEVLSEVGADQTAGNAAAGHTDFMAEFRAAKGGASLAEMHATVRKALVAASALAGQKQTATLEAFLQGPGFTGTYSAQSGEVVGILKNMRDTFKANLKDAIKTEEKDEKAHNKYIENMEKAHDNMDKECTRKEGTLGSNDDILSSQRSQLDDASEDLKNAEVFLQTLIDDRDLKTKQYNQRSKLRLAENAAIAEAISILNSDAAFATFGSADATRTGATSFVQYGAISLHMRSVSAKDALRQKSQAFLQREAASQHSPLLTRVAALLQAKNPFADVLSEIDKIISLIAAEEKADDEQMSWCDEERTNTDKSIVDKEDELNSLNSEINELKKEINDPKTGLLTQQAGTESALDENHDTQVTKTKQRKEENAAYQKDIANLQDAEALLKRAKTVLANYYSKIDATVAAELLQAETTTFAPPETFEKGDDYAGQSSAGGSAIDMLSFIAKNTKAEENQAHEDEMESQHAFEDDMVSLKKEEEDMQDTLAGIQKELAQKELDLKRKNTDHKATNKEKVALETYVQKIKPGCDFITKHIETRKSNRAKETDALNKVQGFLKDSPAYTEAEAQKHDDSLGKCLPICEADGEEHAKCKACLAKVSVPGYCAGHEGTTGC